jgi:hypothetical protein
MKKFLGLHYLYPRRFLLQVMKLFLNRELGKISVTNCLT